MKFPDLRMVGDTVGRLVLAECEEAMVTKVEGLPNHPFYRTSRGICYSYEEGAASVDEAHRKELLENSGIITTEAPEHSMSRLYWSRHGFYASARYVQFNG